MDEEEQSKTENGQTQLKKLIHVLIAKIQYLERDNQDIRKSMKNPMRMMQQAGFIPASTPFPEDVDDSLLKDEVPNFEHRAEAGPYIPTSNEEFHDMSWEEVHDLADRAVET